MQRFGIAWIQISTTSLLFTRSFVTAVLVTYMSAGVQVCADTSKMVKESLYMESLFTLDDSPTVKVCIPRGRSHQERKTPSG